MPARTESASEPHENEVTLTQLRKNIYQLVDEVIASGKPLTLNRRGCSLRLAVVSPAQTKLGNLKNRDTLIGSVEDLENEQFQQWEADHGFD
ncbi:MAG: hypothetical protein ACR2PX_14750 [Endozoicomonas sp.]|uniref:hypothetical protein n=1 Tax=Endozoicomonas sp. TaxID=1892382 RepID=UPI003D9AD2B4